ncbi:MAG: DUF1835 domain-containing protein [Balneolaceae bacterium]
MITQFHILNGDALKEQFPKALSENVIVIRECLIEGNVEATSSEELFQIRSKFIASNYDEATIEGYFEQVVSEFAKIKTIPKEAEINLWFEDDLFCQTNFWFTAHLIKEFKLENAVFLIRPKNHTQYGFAAYDTEGLQLLYKNRTYISEVETIQKLWCYYQAGKTIELKKIAESLKNKYPFFIDAVRAHIERIPTKNKERKPKRVLKEIINRQGFSDFGQVFQEFTKRESIYGFGDSQVKRIFDEIQSES